MTKRLMSIEKVKPHIVVILGPTASGKSDLAVKLARRFNGEIISADSRQVYRGLDLGSDKIPRDKKPPLDYQLKTKTYLHGGIRHHLLDVASPKTLFTVQKYQRLTRVAIATILRRKKLPIICGGTGLYIDSVIYDTQFPKAPPNSKLRRKLNKVSTTGLFARISRLDPARAKTIERHNRRRLIRAIEIAKALSKVPTLEKSSPYDALKIGIKISPPELKKRIEKRLKACLPKKDPAGTYLLSHDREIVDKKPENVIQEVEQLHYRDGLSWKRLDELGLRYRYVARYLRGLISYEEMKQDILKESYRYAKRQMTWFKRDPQIHWIQK